MESGVLFSTSFVAPLPLSHDQVLAIPCLVRYWGVCYPLRGGILKLFNPDQIQLITVINLPSYTVEIPTATSKKHLHNNLKIAQLSKNYDNTDPTEGAWSYILLYPSGGTSPTDLLIHIILVKTEQETRWIDALRGNNNSASVHVRDVVFREETVSVTPLLVLPIIPTLSATTMKRQHIRSEGGVSPKGSPKGSPRAQRLVSTPNSTPRRAPPLADIKAISQSVPTWTYYSPRSQKQKNLLPLSPRSEWNLTVPIIPTVPISPTIPISPTVPTIPIFPVESDLGLLVSPSEGKGTLPPLPSPPRKRKVSPMSAHKKMHKDSLQLPISGWNSSSNWIEDTHVPFSKISLMKFIQYSNNWNSKRLNLREDLILDDGLVEASPFQVEKKNLAVPSMEDLISTSCFMKNSGFKSTRKNKHAKSVDIQSLKNLFTTPWNFPTL